MTQAVGNVFVSHRAGVCGRHYRAVMQGGDAASWNLPEHGGPGQPAAELQERGRLWGLLQLSQGKTKRDQ